uniref:USP domain-containing protein n=1 Tax=Globodera rostochiensis TaxID=31243 RepID=A0A914HDI6_GLORO
MGNILYAPENLGLHSKIKCDNCGTYEVQHKQLTLRKLPIVACFHLKRFEHMNATMKRQKIKYPVRYPEFIDLTPYTTSHRNALSPGDQQQQLREGTSGRQLTSLTNRYSLFAVVNHNGSTESGHYSCYIRHQHDNWYNCNDQKITRERIDKVLASEGYLLFYCKSYIDYD